MLFNCWKTGLKKQEGRQKMYCKDVEGKCGFLKMARERREGQARAEGTYVCVQGPLFPLMFRIS